MRCLLRGHRPFQRSSPLPVFLISYVRSNDSLTFRVISLMDEAMFSYLTLAGGRFGGRLHLESDHLRNGWDSDAV